MFEQSDQSVILKKIPEQDFVNEKIKDLYTVGHHIPLNVLASSKCEKDVWKENYKLHSFIRFEPFENLVGKRLFGIQPIEGCCSCVFPEKSDEVYRKKDVKNEHNIVGEILEESIFVSFFSPKDEYEFWKKSIVDFAKAYIHHKKKGNIKKVNFAISDFASEYRPFNFDELHKIGLITSNDAKIILENIGLSDSDMHPRLWLFVGDSVISFQTYLLFNSNHGHPHMDNWYLVNWKLSQPQATDMFKMIGHNITSINIHDINHNMIDSFTMKADYDEWMKYCGKSNEGYNVPSEKYYPILEIDASIKKIQLGTKWYSCHYPVSIYNII